MGEWNHTFESRLWGSSPGLMTPRKKAVCVLENPWV